MSKKTNMMVGLATTSILLAACSGMSPEDIKETTDELELNFNEMIQTHGKLVEYESSMNTQFEEVLAQDEELASLEDDSADVVQNITEREALVEDFLTQVENIQSHAEDLEGYEGEDFSEETMQQLASSFQTFSSDAQTFYDTYKESLTTQKEYLEQIASEEANYESFAAGIETVNDDYLELQQTTLEFDDKLVAFDEELTSLQEEVSTKVEAESNEAAEEETAAEEVDQNTDDNEEVENIENSEENEETLTTESEDVNEGTEGAYLTINNAPLLRIPRKFPQKFAYDSGVNIDYPTEGVKGIYVTAHSAGGDRMDYLTNLINTTDLNAMVIDVKDDYGNITLQLETDNELINEMTFEMFEAEEVMSIMEENNIYPIARIVVFKDTLLAKERPELSFTYSDGSVWTNGNGDGFVNPYLKEVWDYNIDVAVEVAKLGFKEIQFDYVRFPEGFETRDRELNYSHGHYGDDNVDVINMEYRNKAVTDFVAYSKEKLQPYGVDVSVDIFGYAAVVRETPGIGQSFPGISREVDVISSMIYPSHWGLGNLDVAIPDLDPYNVVANYAVIENEIMEELGDEAPISRPWIQDFTASYLGAGFYKTYGAAEVTEQVRALHDNGINEFLLWNAGNTYSEDATFSFE